MVPMESLKRIQEDEQEMMRQKREKKHEDILSYIYRGHGRNAYV